MQGAALSFPLVSVLLRLEERHAEEARITHCYGVNKNRSSHSRIEQELTAWIGQPMDVFLNERTPCRILAPRCPSVMGREPRMAVWFSLHIAQRDLVG